MMRDELTKESYTSLFDDNFELTHHAIEVARKQIEQGNEELNVTQMLKEIRKHPPQKEEKEDD
ncbi:hypothetical protein [Candidatus Neptunochlamydia vexilliferae]|uniref:Uncharacterized protein n=1 Tax=Candidatus Neptunichlamydia vexilliferae TaxID=1651774 RepID=A0ABS0AZD6_9BACT|nr:hypothetical protein [Candidatus Neptunochlamydia vexilliferae]MBF5059493.1 hypothetical protein [Candidatus Neptunochlamydia vexilliferae]